MHSATGSLKGDGATALFLIHFRRFLYVKVIQGIMKQRYEQPEHE